MSFLAPLFLLGALAVAAPILLHLLRRTARERMPFSSLMFLSPALPRITRRSRLENLLLLLLRCLVLLLLAFGFARPFLKRPEAAPPSSTDARQFVILIDTSASMRRPGAWQAARARAEHWIKNASGADQLALMTFDRHARSVLSFEEWTQQSPPNRLALLLQRLDSLAPTWANTHLGSALGSAIDSFDQVKGDSDFTHRQIIVITDLQDGSRLDGLQGYEWPRGTTVLLDPVKPQSPGNAGVQIVLDHEDSAAPSTESATRVRVFNSSDAQREQFQLGWGPDGQLFKTDIYVPPGQSRLIHLPNTNAVHQQLRLLGDVHDFDNTAFFLPSKAADISVLYLGDDSPSQTTQPLYYLQRAFQGTRRQNVKVIAHNPATPVPQQDLDSAALLVISDRLPPSVASAIQPLIQSQGKTALVILKKPETAESVHLLTGLGAIQAEEDLSGKFALLGQIEFQHPLFAPFADPRFSDFSKIHFWKHRRISGPGVDQGRILARFDTGDPALVQFSAGKGSVLLFASGWQPADSQFALSSKFVPLLHSILELSSESKPLLSQYKVGDPVALSTSQASRTITIRKPDQSEITWDEALPFTATDLPGIYTVLSQPEPRQFVVNMDPAESKTTPIILEELERLGLPLHADAKPASKQSENKRRQLVAVELEQQQKLWRWLIVAAFILLITETFVAARPFLRPSSAETSP